VRGFGSFGNKLNLPNPLILSFSPLGRRDAVCLHRFVCYSLGSEEKVTLVPIVTIDGIATRYEVIGSGPPLLMYAPGGFNAVVEAWSTLGSYARIKLLDHLPKRFTCILFDRRECGQSGGRVERVTWQHFVAQGKGLLDHLGIKSAAYLYDEIGRMA